MHSSALLAPFLGSWVLGSGFWMGSLGLDLKHQIEGVAWGPRSSRSLVFDLWDDRVCVYLRLGV